MMERLISVKVTARGMSLEALEIVYPVSRVRLLVEHLTDMSLHTLELRPV